MIDVVQTLPLRIVTRSRGDGWHRAGYLVEKPSSAAAMFLREMKVIYKFRNRDYIAVRRPLLTSVTLSAVLLWTGCATLKKAVGIETEKVNVIALLGKSGGDAEEALTKNPEHISRYPLSVSENMGTQGFRIRINDSSELLLGLSYDDDHVVRVFANGPEWTTDENMRTWIGLPTGNLIVSGAQQYRINQYGTGYRTTQIEVIEVKYEAAKNAEKERRTAELERAREAEAERKREAEEKRRSEAEEKRRSEAEKIVIAAIAAAPRAKTASGCSRDAYCRDLVQTAFAAEMEYMRLMALLYRERSSHPLVGSAEAARIRSVRSMPTVCESRGAKEYFQQLFARWARSIAKAMDHIASAMQGIENSTGHDESVLAADTYNRALASFRELFGKPDFYLERRCSSRSAWQEIRDCKVEQIRTAKPDWRSLCEVVSE